MSGAIIGKGNYRHFMLKEIYEQPTVIGDTLHAVLNPATNTITMPPLPCDFAKIPRVTISACGTAYYAGLVAKYWMEQHARVPVEIDVASEFRYREAPMPEEGLAVFVSQSGETMDTIAALRYARESGQHIISVVNVPESSIARGKRRGPAHPCRTRNRRRLGPRPSRRSLPCWPACRSIWRGRAARSTPSASGFYRTPSPKCRAAPWKFSTMTRQ